MMDCMEKCEREEAYEVNSGRPSGLGRDEEEDHGMDLSYRHCLSLYLAGY